MSARHTMLVYWVCGNYRARATLVPWTTEKLVWAAVVDSHDHTACALLFTLFSAQFLVYFLSNGGDRGLRGKGNYCCGSTALMFAWHSWHTGWWPTCRSTKMTSRNGLYDVGRTVRERHGRRQRRQRTHCRPVSTARKSCKTYNSNCFTPRKRALSRLFGRPHRAFDDVL